MSSNASRPSCKGVVVKKAIEECEKPVESLVKIMRFLCTSRFSCGRRPRNADGDAYIVPSRSATLDPPRLNGS